MAGQPFRCACGSTPSLPIIAALNFETKMKQEDIVTAHKASIYHRDQILGSDLCGCFHCCAIFQPSKITEWTDYQAPEVGADKIGLTALCPECAIDSVIGSESGYPITEEFLTAMSRHWF